MGKLIARSLGEVAPSAAILDHYAKHAEAFLARLKLATPKAEVMVEGSPKGVLLGVAPWNCPHHRIARFGPATWPGSQSRCVCASRR